MKREEIIGLILKSEGGLNENEPAHVGGVSYAGITQKTYEAWNIGRSHTPESVRDLDDYPEIINEFYTDYLAKFHVWELPGCLQYIHADFSINAGAAATRIIQSIVGVEADGVWGSGTSNAVAEWKEQFEQQYAEDTDADDRLITEYHEAKLQHYRGLAERKPDVYLKWLPGWEKRCRHVLAQLAPYFDDETPKMRAVDEDDVEVFQSDVDRDDSKENDLATTPIEPLSTYSSTELLQELIRRENA